MEANGIEMKSQMGVSVEAAQGIDVKANADRDGQGRDDPAELREARSGWTTCGENHRQRGASRCRPSSERGRAVPRCWIGSLPAWRGVPAAAAAALQGAKQMSDTAITVAEAATVAAAGTPGAPAAKAAEEATKAACAAQMGSMITSMAGGADIHTCATPLPIPPHGPGS